MFRLCRHFRTGCIHIRENDDRWKILKGLAAFSGNACYRNVYYKIIIKKFFLVPLRAFVSQWFPYSSFITHH
jgi:hypothetical protein